MGYMWTVYSEKDELYMRKLSERLQEKYMHISNSTIGFEPGSTGWWNVLENTMNKCHVAVILLSASVYDSPRIKRELDLLNERNIPVVPVLISHTVSNSLPIELKDMIDFTRKQFSQSPIDLLANRLYSIVGISPQTTKQRVYDTLYSITVRFPEIKWVRISTIDGLPRIHFKDGDFQIEAREEAEEDRISPLSTGILSFSERATMSLDLGTHRHSIISGSKGMFFVLAIGSGTELQLAMSIEGQISIPSIVEYFAEHDYLENLEMLLDLPYLLFKSITTP